MILIYELLHNVGVHIRKLPAAVFRSLYQDVFMRQKSCKYHRGVRLWRLRCSIAGRMLIPMGYRSKAGGYYSMQICPALIESGSPSLLKAYSHSFWAVPLKYHYLLLRGENIAGVRDSWDWPTRPTCWIAFDCWSQRLDDYSLSSHS